jgi:ribosomal protein L37AE/L43A
VHLNVQYSDPGLPAMTRRIASGAWHSGQCDSTTAEGDWVGAVSDSTMGCAIFKIGLAVC